MQPQVQRLLRMVAGLDESREVVALIDSDVVPHSRWLRELVAPLRQPRVGAAFGNRWYMPRYGDWGSVVRYLWNAAAVVPMWLCSIPWAGTFAIRTKVLRDCGLLKKWSLVMAEDAPAKQALEDQGLRLRFVPSLMMVNREDCTLAFGLDFIKRQPLGPACIIPTGGSSLPMPSSRRRSWPPRWC